MLQPPEEPLDAALRNLGAEVIGGDVLEVMGFVHDEPRRGRQHAARRIVPENRAELEVAQQQVMVDDQQLGPEGVLASLVEEATLVLRTTRAQAVVVLGGDGVPGVRTGHEWQVGERAVCRRVRPVENRPDLGSDRVVEKERRGFAHLGRLPQAHVLPRPFTSAAQKGTPRWAARSGRSTPTNCSWRLMVWVETMTRSPL